MVDVNQYIDNCNENLWKEFSGKFNINVKYSTNNYYSNFLKDKVCTIYVLRDVPDYASFTHELLHLYLPYHKVYIGGAIKCMLSEKNVLNTIFDAPLYDHISNCLEHIKMLPLFVGMGYPIDKFLKDYYSEKLTVNEVERLCKGYKKGFISYKYDKRFVNYFIGKFFAAKADINQGNDYKEQLKKLKELDNELYIVLDSFWKEWVNYDVEKKREIWEDNYNDLVTNLSLGLESWCSKRRFV